MTQTGGQPENDNPGVIAPPPLIFLGVLALALAIDWALNGPTLGLPFEARMVAGVIFFGAGAALIAAGVARFLAAKTNPQPWKPATALVISGVYRYTRNPMYLGMALAYVGLSVFANSVIGLAGLPVALGVMHYGVIAREERYMEGKFGEEYRVYKRRVRRWV